MYKIKNSFDDIKKILFVVAMAFELNSSVAIYNSIQYFVLLLLVITLLVEKRIKIDHVLFGILVFSGWNFITILWSIDSMASLSSSVMIAKWVFLLFFLSNQRWDNRFLIKAFVLINTVDALLLLPNIDYVAAFAGRRGHHILWGVEWAANVAAGMFSISIVLAYYLIIREKKKIRQICIIIAQLIMMADILLMGSRQGLLSAVLGCLCLYYINKGKRITVKSILLILAVIIVIVVGLYCIMTNSILYHTLGQRLLGLADTKGSDTGRIAMIKMGLDLFIKKPLLGYGANTYYIASGKMAAYAHNNFVELLVDTGIIGFVLYHIPLVWVVTHLSKKMPRIDRALSISCIMLSLLFEMVIVTNPLFVYNFLIWIVYSYTNSYSTNEVSVYEP